MEVSETMKCHTNTGLTPSGFQEHEGEINYLILPLAPQSVFQEAAAMASPGSLLEMDNFASHPALLSGHLQFS